MKKRQLKKLRSKLAGHSKARLSKGDNLYLRKGDYTQARGILPNPSVLPEVAIRQTREDD